MLEILVLILFVLVIYLLYKNLEWKYKFEERIKKEEERIKEEAIARSARTLSGKALEKFVPFLKDFKYDPHDVRWLGDPIDLVIFDGCSSSEPRKIVFCEVKSGSGSLNKTQRNIKELIENKKVEWEEFKVERR